MTSPQHTPSETSGRRRAAGAIVVTTAVLGGLALVGVGLSSTAQAFWTARTALAGSVAGHAEIDSAGITGIDVEVGSGELTVRFGDVEEATIDAEGGDFWQMRRSGNDLVVETRGTPFDLCLGWCGYAERRATVTLPRELEERGIEADLSLGAGSLTLLGDFRSIDLEVGAGEAVVEGSADRVEMEVSAGRLDAELTDVRQASFTVSAGGGKASLNGEAPSEVDVDVSAGSLTLLLPDEAYNVSVDSAAGDVTEKVRTDPASRHRVTGEVSAGSLVLLPSS